MAHVDKSDPRNNKLLEDWFFGLSSFERQAVREQQDDLGLDTFDYYFHYVADTPVGDDLMTNGPPGSPGGPPGLLDDLLGQGGIGGEDPFVTDIMARGDLLIGGFVGGGAARGLAALGAIFKLAGMSGRIAIRNPWKTSIGAEAIDLFTPEIDLPSPSDIPGALVSVSAGTWRAIRELIDIPLDVLGNFGFSIPGLGGGGLVVETDPMSPYGPIVKRWTAGVTPFVLTQFGWIGARKKSGVWSWYKPKKPLVVVPGHPPDARTARKLATIWKRERKQAKKIFDLVDRGGTTRRRAPQTINIEAGPGSIHS